MSNQIKSLFFLLSHHHSTSALVSEILMSVLQTVQKNNRQFTYGQTVQKKQQTIYIWTDSAKKTTDNLHMDRQCKKNNRQFTYGQTVQKKQQTIYIWTDSAKKTALEHLQCSRQCKKTQQQQFTYGQYIFTDCTEDNVQNTHTYTRAVTVLDFLSPRWSSNKYRGLAVNRTTPPPPPPVNKKLTGRTCANAWSAASTRLLLRAAEPQHIVAGVRFHWSGEEKHFQHERFMGRAYTHCISTSANVHAAD